MMVRWHVDHGNQKDNDIKFAFPSTLRDIQHY